MSAINKRPAEIPSGARFVVEQFSKSDLAEALWDLASLANDAGSIDDHASTLAKLVEMLNARRDSRGAKRFDLAAYAKKLAVCAACKGTGQLMSFSSWGGPKEHPCSSCKGSGKTGRDLIILQVAAVMLSQSAGDDA